MRRLIALLRPTWTTVAIVARQCSANHVFDLMEGIVRVPRIDARYRFLLQEDARGRRRVRTLRLDPRLTRSQTRMDPVWQAVAGWRRGGALPAQAI